MRVTIVLILAFAVSCGNSSSSTDTTLDSNPGDGSGDLAGDTGGSDIGSDLRQDGVQPDTRLDTTEVDTGSGCAYSTRHVLPGPCEEGFDPDLERRAFAHDRQFHLFNAVALGVNTDISIGLDKTDDRKAIEDFLTQEEGWDFRELTGKDSTDMITTNHKVAGLYAGMGIVADAYRYAVLRDQGYPKEEVDIAREHLQAAIETLHTAQEITGVEGVIARGLAKVAWNTSGQYDPLPLFDDQGNPLPTEKNNGAWRADNSGKHPDLVWEDSISRDMLIGWAAAMGAVWEVIAEDDTFDQGVKTRLQADASALGHALMVVRPSGYDMEVPDADGRTTLHGYLNEHNIDGQFYNDAIQNGFHAIMGLGIVASYYYVSQDPEIGVFLNDKLIGERDLPGICKDSMMLVDEGVGSNYSNYNMAFTGAWLATRYVQDQTSRDKVRLAIKNELYCNPKRDRQACEIGYSLFDFTYYAAMADTSVWKPGKKFLDQEAWQRGVDTLQAYSNAPYWDYAVVNCPDAQCDADHPDVANPNCIGIDGTEILLLGCVGRNGDLVAAEPIPWRILGPSNYHWRSNPYKPNREGDGSSLLPGVDYRVAYWIGRYTQLAD